MVTVSNKIELFTRVVMDKLTEQYNQKAVEMDLDIEKALKAYDKEAHMRAEAYIEQFVEDAKLESKRLVSKAKTKVRNGHIETRQVLQKEFDRRLKERLAKFSAEEGYKLFLIERIQNALPEIATFDKVMVELLENDLATHKGLIEEELAKGGITESRVSFRTVQKGMSGGLIFFNGDAGIRIDNSLDAVVEDQSRVISRLLSDILDEVGDTNE